MAMKKCKECGEEISSSAKECPKCGKKQKPSGCLIAVIVIVVLIIIGACMGGSDNNSNTNNSNLSNNSNNGSVEEKQIEYTVIDIDVLEEALKKNAAAAKDTYNNQYLEITGRLGTIDSDLKYISLLSTTDDWDLTGIHCSIKNDEQKNIIKTLSKDDIIVVKGKITDVGEVLGYYLDITEIPSK